MNFAQNFPLVLVLILVLMTFLCLISIPLKNASIVDEFWGLGFVIVALTASVLAPTGFPPRKTLLLTMVILWGVRLSLHIFIRNFGKPEDRRYATWRGEAGPHWW